MFRLESSRIEDRNHLGAPIVVWTQVGSRSLAVRPTEVPSAVYAWVVRPLFVQHGLWPRIFMDCTILSHLRHIQHHNLLFDCRRNFPEHFDQPLSHQKSSIYRPIFKEFKDQR